MAINFEPYTINEAINTPNVKRFNNLENFSSPIYYCVETRTSRSSYKVMDDICSQFKAEGDNCILFKMTLKELCDLVNAGYLKLNRKNKAHEIPVQRGDVTTPSSKSRMIVGLINKDNTLPVLDMQMFVDKNGELCMKPQDGNQRSNAIYGFVVEGMKLCGTNTVLDGKSFKDFPSKVKEAIENRSIYVRILEKGCNIQFAARFRILNTTQTKMSPGELLNTKNSENEAFQKARELMRTNKSVNMIFGKASPASPIIKEDTRMLNMSRFAFSVCSTYLMNTVGIPATGTKYGSLNKLVDEVMSMAMDDHDVMDDLCNLFEIAPSVCKNVERYFGGYFCNALVADTILTTSRKTYIRDAVDDCKHFIPGYKHYARQDGKKSQSIQSIVFYTTFSLMNASGKLIVSDDAMKQIVTNIDNMLGDSDYHDAFEEHKGSAYTGKRIEHIMNECVIPVCDKEGVSIAC